MSDQPNDNAAYAESTRLQWSRWKNETAEEFRARVTSEGERLGLPIVFHQVTRRAGSRPPAPGPRSGDAAA